MFWWRDLFTFKGQGGFHRRAFLCFKNSGSADYIRSQDITRQWMGIRLFNNELNHFILDFTYAREFGNENGKSISAYGVVAKAGYQFQSLPAKPVFCIRESFASGGTNDEARIRTFEPAYGSRDQYYGRMNITSWSNLDDREIILYLFPVNGMKLELSYHRYKIPVPEDATLLGTIKMQEGNHHLGDEFNIFADYQINNKMKLTGAYGWFGAGDIEPVNGQPAGSSTWASIQITYALNTGR
ncbi:MAG: alginate export family protein [Bacteroidales bacterium]|nr:alginate export family protein [Bacteroidales bacterium]